MLGNLADNACKWGHAQVSLRAEAVSAPGAGGLQIRIIVDDDGPGIPPPIRAEIFDRGKRGDESKPGSGLDGGLRAILVLPGARAPATEE